MEMKDFNFTTQLSSPDTVIVYSDIEREKIPAGQKLKLNNSVWSLLFCVFLFVLVVIAIMIFYEITDTDKTLETSSIPNRYGNPGKHGNPGNYGNPGKVGNPGQHGNPGRASPIISITTVKQRIITETTTQETTRKAGNREETMPQGTRSQETRRYESIAPRTTSVPQVSGNCSRDQGLTDFSSAASMKSNGWVFSKSMRHKPIESKEICNDGDTWYGSGNASFASLTATFSGTGMATLSFGNCNKKGMVTLVKSDQLGKGFVEAAEGNNPSREISFEYSPNQFIKLKSSSNAAIKLNFLQIHCKQVN